MSRGAGKPFCQVAKLKKRHLLQNCDFASRPFSAQKFSRDETKRLLLSLKSMISTFVLKFLCRKKNNQVYPPHFFPKFKVQEKDRKSFEEVKKAGRAIVHFLTK